MNAFRGSAFDGFNGTDIRYIVKFVEIFKVTIFTLMSLLINSMYLFVLQIPEELNGTLPTEVYTPESEAGCGLRLEKGGEYLLSGKYIFTNL